MPCNFIEIKLRYQCSPVNLQHIFRTPFPKNTSGGLLLSVVSTSTLLVHVGLVVSPKPYLNLCSYA